jgi:hypothetical protein
LKIVAEKAHKPVSAARSKNSVQPTATVDKAWLKAWLHP